MAHHDNMRPYMHLFWAKAQPYGQPGPERIHLLEHHLADVGACFEALMRIPTIRKRLAASGGIHHPDDLHESVVARLSVFAALHDVGKVNVGFQARVWRNEDLGGKPKPRLAGHDADMVPVLMDEDHETAGWFFAALGWWDDAISSWDEHSGETVCALFVAALSHHGRPLKLEGGRSRNPAIWRPFADLKPAKYVKRLGRLAQSWFPAAFVSDAPPLPSTPAFQHMFLGLCNWADWIGSDERRFSYCGQPREDYIDTARNRAKEAVEAMGLDLSAQRNSFEGVPEFATLFGIDGSPNAIQQAVRQTPLDRRLVIIESETGSGKTEAALWRFARMYKAGLVDGIYFALPTRSAAVQIYQRVKRFTAKLFPRCTPPTVLAVPGYQPSKVATPIEIPPYDDRSAGSRPDLIPWASEHPKRYLAAQVAVGTVDQAMMGALRVKNAHMRFACLSRNLLVVDEVHASDTYMNIVLEALLDAHLGAGGYALLMSATLGSVARHRWLDHGKRAAGRSLPTLADAVEQPYPAVSYTYTATDGDGDTASLRFTIRVDPEPIRPPPSPKGLSASVVRDSCDREHCDVAFSWPSKSGYSRYKIYYSHHRSGANAPRHFDGQWIGTVSGSATSFTKTNLDCDYNYQFRSRAQGDGVTYTTTWSSYGNPANVVARCTDSPQPPPVSPQPPGGNAPVDSNTITNGGADLFEVTITSTPPTANPENHWPMFEARQLVIEITGRNGGALPAGFTTFRLQVDPDDTGLQSRGTTVCDFSGAFPTTAVDINPPKDVVTVVRCGRGTPSSDPDNDGITIETDTPSGRVLTIFTLPVNEAIHRPAGSVTYWVDPPNMFPADVAVVDPAGNSIRPAIPPALGDTTVYAQGAQAWNRALTGYPGPQLVPATTKSGAGIVIQGYRVGDSLNYCGASVACTNRAGTPPDMGNGQPFWLRATPQGTRTWTNDYSLHYRENGFHAYLPWTVAHEFGHAIGLGHSTLDGTIMSGVGSQEAREIPDLSGTCHIAPADECGLSVYDIAGANAIY